MSTPYMGEIRLMSFNFAPKGWTQCNGQTLPINQNQALFSLLGTMYGGNGQTTFQLPDLRGRVPIGFNGGYVLGQTGGQTAHTVTLSEMPQHTHALMADANTTATTSAPTNSSVLGVGNGAISGGGSFNVNIYSTTGLGTTLAPQVVSSVGGNQPHENMQPYLCVNFCIALQGIFPSQN